MKTYGRLDLDAGTWRLTEVAPHVAMALKRLFPRIPKGATEFEMSDTDEIRADLHWFMQRYPLAHDHARTLREGRNRIADRIAMREMVLRPTWQAGETPGFKEGKAPYLYQAQAAKIAISNPDLLCGDDVGLGKTITALATLTSGAPLPAAVVVQPHLADQWAARIEEFTSLSCHIVKGRMPYDLPAADIFIFRYSNVAGWVDLAKDGFLKTVIYDEVQELRHGRTTGKGGACGLLTDVAELRLGLTATPIYNYGDEMHAVMEFIRPGLLGDRLEFMLEWCGGHKTVRDPDALGTYLRDTGFYLRRTEDDETVDASMPPANVLDFEVAWNTRDADADDETARTLALAVLNASFVEAGKAARELDARLRQLTGIAKARAVAAYVKMLLTDSPRVLLAGWHREVYEIWRTELTAFNPVLYTGSETGKQKAASVKAFTTGDARVMMISLRSGAGLDGLQYHCNEVVIGELDWSPMVHKQVIGRCRRPGQERQVNAHYLHVADGSDPVIMEMLGIKTDQARGINDPGIAPKQRHADDSRIRRLAQHVLGIPQIGAGAMEGAGV